MYMNDEQIRKDYRRALDKRDAIRILARVNGVTVTAMREHLFLLNEELPPRRQDTVDKTRFPALYRQGLSDREIAQAAGCSVSTAYQWRKKNGLPPVRETLEPNAQEAEKRQKGGKAVYRCCCGHVFDRPITIQAREPMPDGFTETLYRFLCPSCGLEEPYFEEIEEEEEEAAWRKK